MIEDDTVLQEVEPFVAVWMMREEAVTMGDGLSVGDSSYRHDNEPKKPWRSRTRRMKTSTDSQTFHNREPTWDELDSRWIFSFCCREKQCFQPQTQSSSLRSLPAWGACSSFRNIFSDYFTRKIALKLFCVQPLWRHSMFSHCQGLLWL